MRADLQGLSPSLRVPRARGGWTGWAGWVGAETRARDGAVRVDRQSADGRRAWHAAHWQNHPPECAESPPPPRQPVTRRVRTARAH